MKKRTIRFVAKVTMLALANQVLYPTLAMALTSGPTQPEVHAFEPVSTTEMVDMFTGDFVYNIPLLDIEGYPVNISYHGGGNVEEEASWVGLGWSINPGVLNRAVRGVPDDFQGENIEKLVKIKPERNIRAGAGVGLELAGLPKLKAKKKKIKASASLGLYVNHSNYRGLSAGTRVGLGLDLMGFASAGINLGIGSQSGADIDYSAGISYSSSNKLSKEEAMGVGVTVSHGYNTRSGYKDVRISGNMKMSRQYEGKPKEADDPCKSITSTGGTTAAKHMLTTSTHFASNSIPIGMQNYVPVITNKSALVAVDVNLNLGGEVFWIFPNGDLSLMVSKLSYNSDATKKAYGYMYADKATEEDILDFTRDKDGMFNATMAYLPPGNMTYDLYSATAQGGGGLFRPYRNDFGSVFDPQLGKTQQDQHAIHIEAGLGNVFEVGGDYTGLFTDIEAGPWQQASRNFKGKTKGTLYEDVYFKQAGELTTVNDGFLSAINNIEAHELNPGNIQSLPQTKSGSANSRDPRGNLVYFFTAKEAQHPEISTSSELYNYTDPDGLKNGPNTARQSLSRTSGNRKDHHLSEVVQLKEDGSRYVYGLPAMNNVQSEYAFSVERGSGTTVNDAEGVVAYGNGDDGVNNSKGIENYFSRTVTPAYAHSYLLTSVLSHDYVDVTGNGITDDDLGGYTRFNYSRKESDYRWRSPYAAGTAQYNPGYNADRKDDRGYYTVGSKELWYMHSIETKNYVAEFYTAARQDAKGALGSALASGTAYAGAGYSAYTSNVTTSASSYKLDSIVLYNKHDRFINQGAAQPVKSVIFDYTYDLCPGAPNATTGKLTLKKIFTRFGRSDKNLISPYQFVYDNTYNYPYNQAAKNRWGGYKAPNPNLPNAEFPYVNQEDADNNKYASAWQLTQILLPSGGAIDIEYESDDYAYVQDRRAMEMWPVEGVGASSNFQPNTTDLYTGPNNPNLYVYFKKRAGSGFMGSGDISKIYLQGQDALYYNFYVDIASKGIYDPVRGYAGIDGVGTCPNNTQYGYVKLSPRQPKGSNTNLSPITYTSLNIGRYNLPHVFHPGSDYDASALLNIMRGLAAAAKDLFTIFKNPLKRYAEEGKAKKYDKAKSAIRLMTPDLKKKGGGTRVKSLILRDRWNAMATGEPEGAYGKTYRYTLQDDTYGTISSGVASYEPSIGGDENPFKIPVRYNANSGTKFPPNDPVELYQEEPIGESLYPSPVVGYSRVEVESIHAESARSAQTVDRFDFYTAKDFPIRVKSTAINRMKDEKKMGLLKSKVEMQVAQGYSIIMNDMHGKPKANYSYVVRSRTNPNGRELVSSNVYEYRTDGGGLSNQVQALVYDAGLKKFVQQTKHVGQEVDVTIDSRHKSEKTHTTSLALNLNFSFFGPLPLPMPMAFTTPSDHDRLFSSVVTTKVVQQYGILKSIESLKEGAKTKTTYELYDPNTGIALLSKVNNEFNDLEYAMNVPAYWSKKGMGPAYQNQGFEEDVPTLKIYSSYGLLLTSNENVYNVGDEVMLRYNQGSGPREIKVWVDGMQWDGTTCRVVVKPRRIENSLAWPTPSGSTPTTISNVSAKIVRSGKRNQLKDFVQSTMSLTSPMAPGYLAFDPQKTISAQVQVYDDQRVRWLQPTVLPDTNKLNRFAMGYAGNFRVVEEHAYLGKRLYAGHARQDGTFTMSEPFWQHNPSLTSSGNQYERCKLFSDEWIIPVNYSPMLTSPWKRSRKVEAYTPWGNEIENFDALNVPSAAQFGFDNTLPTAVASNSRHHQFLSEGFEDYRMLYVPGVFARNTALLKEPHFALAALAGMAAGTYVAYSITGTGGSLSTVTSHTGAYSLLTGGTGMAIPVTTANAFYLQKFGFEHYKQYVVSCWLKPTSGSAAAPAVASLNGSGGVLGTVTLAAKGTPIEGWQLFEGALDTRYAPFAATWRINLPANTYVDDVRAFPMEANMKAFVYNPYNQKLMATLDENNYATLYEYDGEGLLVRVKKETEKGILTVQESRQSTYKAQ